MIIVLFGLPCDRILHIARLYATARGYRLFRQDHYLSINPAIKTLSNGVIVHDWTKSIDHKQLIKDVINYGGNSLIVASVMIPNLTALYVNAKISPREALIYQQREDARILKNKLSTIERNTRMYTKNILEEITIPALIKGISYSV